MRMIPTKVRADGLGGTRKQADLVDEHVAQHGYQQAAAQGEHEAVGGKDAGLVPLLRAQVPRDGVASALSKEEAHRLDGGHCNKGDANGARG